MTVETYSATPTLRGLRPSFERHLRAANRSPKTIRCYLGALNGLCRFLDQQGMPSGASSIRREHVEAYVEARMRVVKPSSVLIAFRALRVFWNWAVGEDELPKSPMERMKPPAGLVRDFGVDTLLIHHVGHSKQERLRGHSSLKAGVDGTVIFNRTGVTTKVRLEAETKDSDPITVHLRTSEKGRSACCRSPSPA